MFGEAKRNIGTHLMLFIYSYMLHCCIHNNDNVNKTMSLKKSYKVIPLCKRGVGFEEGEESFLFHPYTPLKQRQDII